MKSRLLIKLIFWGFLAILFLITLRLFQIQILLHKEYKGMGQSQYADLQVLQPNRGNIISSDGFVLAGTKSNYLLYAEPQKITNHFQFSEDLSKIIGEIRAFPYTAEASSSVKELFNIYYTRLTTAINSKLLWVALVRNITPEEKDVISSKKIEGIGFDEEPVRFYPEGSLASHVLGFVAGTEKGEKQGYFGIEGLFDGNLKGKAGRLVQERDALGNPILIGGFKKVDSIDGRDIILSINRSVQYIVEKNLKESVEKYDALSGSVIVMDPLTGEIISLANYPTYTPDKFLEEGDDVKPIEGARAKKELKNLAISDIYEPGSVIKPFTIGAAIDLKKINPNTTYIDSGPVRYSNYFIDNWNKVHLGEMNIIQLLQKSNNIGAAWVGHLVGVSDLSKYFENFGFGAKTGIDLAGEDTGTLRSDRLWTDIDVATASFGQGISATPLQVLNALNVYANGGNLITPKIVNKIVDGGHVIDIPNKIVRRVVSENTAQTMTDMLIDAVLGGESKFFNIKNYKIAGKTGTAQIPVDGKYDALKTNTTFIGYLATSKKFSMIVRLQEPKTSIYAAETAVPLWMRICSELIKYYGIAPDF